MPRIEKSVSVNAPVEKVFEVLQQVESFAQFLPHTRQAQVLERTDTGALVEWEVVAPGVGMPVRWKSRYTFDTATHTATMQPEGDALVKLTCEWRVEPEGAGSKLTATVDYTANVPPIFTSVAQNAVNTIIQDWLNGFKQRAEG
ncbi:MAG: SRPBCC family protein [Fimbriimonadales bacterium]|nr:SRPBCC family protein [Fimbriimonadales bacterium]MDW8052441.1 SRPBCC family protein [Armatimonadota bacterium]